MGSSRQAKFDARIAKGCSKKRSQKQVMLIWFATRCERSAPIQSRSSSAPLRCTDGAAEVGKSSPEFANRRVDRTRDEKRSIQVAPTVRFLNSLVKHLLPGFNPSGVMFDDNLLRIP